VYSVYNSLFSALITLLSTVNVGLSFVLGQSRYGDKDRFEKTYDMYSLLYTGVCFVCFTTAAVLAIPFVKLYTRGVTDADYVLPVLSLLFVVVNLLSSSRAVASVLINVSGHAGKTQVRSIAESVINLVTSIILVQFFGIYGVLGGTVIAMLYRSNDMIIYANKRVLGRSPLREYVNLFSFVAAFVLLYMLSNTFKFEINSYGYLFLIAIITFIASAMVYAAIAICLNLKLFKYWIDIIKNKA
ncbi:MAG: hypothetical protein IIV03_06070, partial [Clostridia bacterium]|nr:hypothetical protein [Clostridia bacterium]